MPTNGYAINDGPAIPASAVTKSMAFCRRPPSHLRRALSRSNSIQPNRTRRPRTNTIGCHLSTNNHTSLLVNKGHNNLHITHHTEPSVSEPYMNFVLLQASA